MLLAQGKMLAAPQGPQWLSASDVAVPAHMGGFTDPKSCASGDSSSGACPCAAATHAAAADHSRRSTAAASPSPVSAAKCSCSTEGEAHGGCYTEQGSYILRARGVSKKQVIELLAVKHRMATGVRPQRSRARMATATAS